MEGFVGLISDTHGLLRPEALPALEGAALIIHAGDVGKPAVLDGLRALAPVMAVRGNVDTGAWADALPETLDVEVGGLRLHVLHAIADLAVDPDGYDVILSGHSHQPGWRRNGRTLYINPGSAGPRRFSLPITLMRLGIGAEGPTVEQVDLLA